jgi:3-dehydroquinate synthase
MLAHRLDRAGLVVAVGGGVIGDVAGFAAGTYMRGVALVQAPTTLLAQADAGVGGKTGVNLPAGKNLVGVFHQPSVVLVDPVVPRTQRTRDYRSGLAEIIKHGIIRDDEFLQDLSRNMPRLLDRDVTALAAAVQRSCEIKASVVAGDETEQGLRAVLNFGHTVGHALEVATGYRALTHGEAVAIGMVGACLVGEETGMTPPKVTSVVANALEEAGLPTALPGGSDPAQLVAAMYADKKAVGGTLRFVLVRAIGEAVPGLAVEPETVRRALARSRR